MIKIPGNVFVSKKYGLIGILILLFGHHLFANDIIIDGGKQRVHKPFLGNNLEAYDWTLMYPEREYEHKNENTTYGAGMWNPKKKRPTKNLLKHARHLKISNLRFPGGAGAHHYDWSKTIGPLEKRKKGFLFGPDEFMQVVESLAVDPMITLSYFDFSNQYQADLIEYLVAKVGRNPNGGKEWARVRAANGRKKPYKIPYVEFGNEVYLGDEYDETHVDPVEYAKRYKQIKKLIHNIDPQIQLGAVLKNSIDHKLSHWDLAVVKEIGKELDFAVIHFYPMWYQSNDNKLNAEQIFKTALTAPDQIQYNLESYHRQLYDLTGKKIPIAVTEFNGGFAQNEPVPYRHTLGNALLNWDMIRAMAEADVPMVSANYWQFSNNYWGVLYNKNYMRELDRGIEGDYIKRPNYFALEMFARYFTGQQLKTVVVGQSYTSGGYSNVNGSRKLTRRLNKLHFSSSPKSKTFQVKLKKQSVHLNFPGTFDSPINYPILKPIPVKANHRYRLTAKFKSKNLNLSQNGFYLALSLNNGENHSAINSSEVLSTQLQWQPVYLEFKTDSNTRQIKVNLKRNKGGGIVNGQLHIAELRLEDMGPRQDFTLNDMKEKGMGKQTNHLKDTSQSHITRFKSKDWSNFYNPWGVSTKFTQNEVWVNFKGGGDPNYYHAKITDIKVKPGHHYRLSGLIRIDELESSNGIYLEVQDQRGWKKTNWAKGTPSHLKTKGWEPISLEFAPLTDSRAIQVMIRRQSGGGDIRGLVKIKGVELEDLGAGHEYPESKFLSTLASIDEQKNKLYLTVLNRHLRKAITSKVWINQLNLKGKVLNRIGKSHVLNGPSVDATNEDNPDRVDVKSKSFSLGKRDDFFRYQFEPHSLTTLEMELE